MSSIPYDLTMIKAVVFDVDGVLSPTCIPMDEKGIPRRMANLRDGYAIQLAIKQNIKIAIITGANDPAIRGRFEALGVKDIFFTSGAKLNIFQKWMSDNNLSSNEVAYVGDDIPDYECLNACGLSVVPWDAAQEVKQVAHYVTKADGGHGVARELLEQLLKVKGLWSLKADANGK